MVKINKKPLGWLKINKKPPGWMIKKIKNLWDGWLK